MASLRRGGGVLPPVLAALYFVLHLAAASWTESRLLSDLRWPVAASLGVALVAWLAAKWLLRDGAKATVLATIVVVGFGAFGYVVQGIARLWHTDPYLVSPWAFLLLDAGLVAAALRLRRSRHQYDQAARFVLLMMGLLAAFAAGRTLLRSVPRVAAPAEVASKPARRAASTARPPDIYLILIDKYTGSRVLRTAYGLDNSGFVDTLGQLGFYVPSAPRANYVHTFLALASILNARYLDELPAQVGVDELSRRPADPLIEHNLLMTELRQRGYRVIFFPTSYPATRRSPLADAQIPSPDRVQPEFVSQWLWTTPIPLVHESACEMFRCRTEFLRYVPESAEFIDWKLAQLAQLAGGAEPIFAFMHLMAPHEPFIYDADCNHRRPYLPGDESGAELERMKRAYVDQVRCVNQKLLRLVRTLQERSVSPPVILLQADHGHGRFGRHLPAYALANTDQRAERASVFAAYALPGAPAAPLPDTVTPINAMRFVLRQYLGMKLPAVDDVTYWSSDDRPYDFVRLPPGELAGPGADGE